MNDEVEVNKPASSGFEAGRWLGRSDAFSLVAGRCTAAQAEALRVIRDGRLYRERTRNWNEFCERELGVSKRHIDRMISYLKEFGPQYFHVAQMTRISPKQYRAIAAHIDEAGVKLDGDVVALLPENQQKVAGAVGQLLRRLQPQETGAPIPAFADTIRRCRSAAEALESAGDLPETGEQRELAEVLLRIRVAALRFGVMFDH